MNEVYFLLSCTTFINENKCSLRVMPSCSIDGTTNWSLAFKCQHLALKIYEIDPWFQFSEKFTRFSCLTAATASSSSSTRRTRPSTTTWFTDKQQQQQQQQQLQQRRQIRARPNRITLHLCLPPNSKLGITNYGVHQKGSFFNYLT